MELAVPTGGFPNLSDPSTNRDEEATAGAQDSQQKMRLAWADIVDDDATSSELPCAASDGSPAATEEALNAPEESDNSGSSTIVLPGRAEAKRFRRRDQNRGQRHTSHDVPGADTSSSKAEVGGSDGCDVPPPRGSYRRSTRSRKKRPCIRMAQALAAVSQFDEGCVMRCSRLGTGKLALLLDFLEGFGSVHQIVHVVESRADGEPGKSTMVFIVMASKDSAAEVPKGEAIKVAENVEVCIRLFVASRKGHDETLDMLET